MPTQANLMGAGCPALQSQASTGIFTIGLTGAGSSSRTAALSLPSDFSVFTTVSANTGARLPDGTAGYTNPGDTWIVVNHRASALLVYPFPSTGKIANGSAGAAFSVGSLKTATFLNIGIDTWAASLSA